MRRSTAAVLVGGVLLLSGCGTAAAPGATGEATAPEASGTTSNTSSASTASTAPSPSGLDVSSLVGTWAVTGPDVPENQKISFEVGNLWIWLPCGHASGSWRGTTTGLFAAALQGGSSDCEGQFDIPWLETLTGWRAEGTSAQLVDQTGRVIADLEPTTPPDVPDFAGVIDRDPTSLTNDVRAALNASPSVGSGITSATREMLVGDWTAVPPKSPPSGGPPGSDWPKAGMTLGDDGTWSGTDGCNGGGGRWNADSSGGIVATSGIRTLVGCNNIDAPGWLGAAFAAGFTADGTLVLFDYQGKELGRLTRA